MTEPGLDAETCDWLFSESESQSEAFFPPPSLPLLLLGLSLDPPPFWEWVLTCLDRWSDRMNLLLQMGQANRFSPVWVLKCRCNSSDRVNRFPQNSQLQTKGRSPVCHLR